MLSVAKSETVGRIRGVVFILVAVAVCWTITGAVAKAAPPAITLNAPGDGAQISEGGTVDLDAQVTDPEAGVLDVSIYGDTSATPTTLLYQRSGLASPADAEFQWGGSGAASEFQLNASTIGLWHLNENTGATAADETGSHDGTVTGAGWTTGQFSSGLSFSNIADTRVRIPDDPAFDTPNLTIQMWVNTTNTPAGWNALLTKGTIPNDVSVLDLGYALLANASGKITLAIGVPPPGNWGTIGGALSATSINDGAWHHVAATYDGTDIRIYIDGDLDSNSTFNPFAYGGGIYYAPGPIDIGASFQRFFNDSWDGLIDEVMISGVALSDAEIRSSYELDLGKYYWYVTATDAAAESSTSSTRSFDVVPLPTVPTLIDPVDAAVTGVNPPAFTWSSTAGAGGTYTLQYTTDVTFTSGVQSVMGITDTTDTLVSALTDDTYYWRVQAFNSAGDSSGYQTPFSFTLDSQAPSVTLNAPADLAQFSELTPVALDAAIVEPEGGAVNVSIYGDTIASPTTLIYSATGLASPADVLFTWPGTIPIEFGVEASTVGLWHLNENTDTTAADETGNFDGSISTATTWTTGRFGSALSFDNTLDTRVQLQDDPAFDTPNLTIQMWVNATSTPATWNAMATKGTLPGTTDLGYALLANASGQVAFAIGNSLGNGWAILGQALGATALGTGSWHHVAATYDGSSVRIYVDGQLDSNGVANPHAFTGGMHQAVGPIDIGASFQRPATDSWNGLIDEVMISDVALSDEEIRAIYTLQANSYYWYVEASDTLGNSNTSATRSFDIVPLPGVPTLIDPPDVAVIGNNLPTFTWSSTAGTGGTYAVQYSTDPTFTTGVSGSAGITATSYTVVSPLLDDTYYWRVQAFNSAGDSSGYQTAFSFTLDTQAPSVTLNAPADLAQFTEFTPVELDAAIVEPEGGAVDVSIYGDTNASPTTLIYSASGLASPADVLFTWPGTVPIEFAVEAGTVALWHFNEGTDTTAADETTNHDGAIQNATWTTGRFGSALTFGGDDRVEIPDSPAWSSTQLTVQAWVNASTLSGTFNVVLSKGTYPVGTTDFGYALATYNGQVELLLGDPAGTGFAVVNNAVGATTLNPGTWYHVAATYDGAQVRIYVNGDLDANGGANPYAYGGGLHNAVGPVDIGSSFQQTTSDSWSGAIDEVMISNVALSAEEIKASYTLQANTYYWYVEASDTLGNSNTSSTRSFGIVPAPDVPVLIDPPDAAVIGNDLPTFTWSSSTEAGGNYTLQYSTDPTFTTGVSGSAGIAETTYAAVSPLLDGTYYWRVQAFNSIGDSSGYPAAFSFAVDTQAPALTLNAPADAIIITEGETLDLDITASDPEGGAVDVWLYGDTNPSPTTLLYSRSGLPSPSDVIYTWGAESEFATTAATVGHWHLNENTGTTATDETGNFDGAISALTTWTPGRFGSALSFDNTLDTRVQLPDDPAFDTPNLTIQMWVNATSTPAGWNALATKGTLPGTTDLGYALLVNTSGQVTLAIGNSSGAGWATIGNALSATSLGTATWHHVAATYDGTDIRIYIDGDLDSNSTFNPYAFSGGMHQAVGPIDIGASFQRAATDSWNGLIDEVRILGVALSDDEIRSSYQLTAGTYSWYAAAADTLGNGTTSATRSFDVVAAPTVPVLEAPLDAALLTASPTLYWTTSTGSGGTYTMQYTTDAGFATGITSVSGITDTTHTFSPALADSTYYWRVQAFNLAGDSSGYQTPFSFTLDTQPPDVPALIRPADGLVTSNDVPTFDWGPTAGAGGTYTLQYALDAGFTTGLQEETGLTDTTYTVAAPLSTATYYWRVKARDLAGNESAYQLPPFSFTVDTRAPEVTLIAPPDGVRIPAGLPVELEAFVDDLEGTPMVVSIFGDQNPTPTTLLQQQSGLASPASILYNWGGGTEPMEFGVTASTVALWHLNENTGTVASDASGNLHTGDVQNATWTAGRFGSGLQFGGDDRVEIPDDPAWNTPQVTVEAWVNADAFSSTYNIVVSKGTFPTPVDLGYALGVYNSQVVFLIGNSDGSSWAVLQDAMGGTTLSPGTWYHVAATYDQSEVRLYVNGMLDSNGTANPHAYAGGLNDAAGPMDIGSSFQQATGDTWDGVIDEVRISNVALSESEIQSIYTLAVGRYYWYVTASDSLGNDSTSETRFFDVDAIPVTPTLIAPPDLAILTDDRPTLVWSSTAGAGGEYVLEYALDTGFTLGLQTIPELTDTTYKIPVLFPGGEGLPDETYYWRVQAIDDLGSESGYQWTPFSFTVDTEAPDVPALISPADSAVISDNTPTLVWSSTADSGGVYVLQYATDPLFTFSVTDTLPDTTFTVSTALEIRDYYWHVRARDGAGNESGYQINPFLFTIDANVPGVPDLLLPLDSSFTSDTTPTFHWSSSIAVSYTLQYGVDPTFATATTVDSVADTTYTVPDTAALDPMMTYYWRAEAVNLADNRSGYPAHAFQFEVFIAGDVNASGTLTSADIIFLVDFIFRGGPVPRPCLAAGDVNCIGEVTTADIIYMVNHIFKGGPPPCQIDQCR